MNSSLFMSSFLHHRDEAQRETGLPRQRSFLHYTAVPGSAESGQTGQALVDEETGHNATKKQNKICL